MPAKSKPKSTASSEAVPGGNMFVTTSSVVNHLNQSLESLNGGVPGRFELQKKLPDGSAVPASSRDIAANDCQTKVQQAAAFVAQLSAEDQLEWANQQRQIANETYANGDTQEAMDLYLTCLVVCPKKDQDSIQKHRFLCEIVAPVLSNLAQCALQLAMYKKAVHFCDMALEESGDSNDTSKTNPTYVATALQEASRQQFRDAEASNSPDPLLSLCKLYFKRSRAYRLTGHYENARKDLTLAQEWLDQASTVTDSSSTNNDNKEVDYSSYQSALDQELRALRRCQHEGTRNKQRQKVAMQKVMQMEGPSDTSVPSTPQRQFSRLRDPKEREREKRQTESEDPRDLSFSNYYWYAVACVVRHLLDWLCEPDVDSDSSTAIGESTEKEKVQ